MSRAAPTNLPRCWRGRVPPGCAASSRSGRRRAEMAAAAAVVEADGELFTTAGLHPHSAEPSGRRRWPTRSGGGRRIRAAWRSARPGLDWFRTARRATRRWRVPRAARAGTGAGAAGRDPLSRRRRRLLRVPRGQCPADRRAALLRGDGAARRRGRARLVLLVRGQRHLRSAIDLQDAARARARRADPARDRRALPRAGAAPRPPERAGLRDGHAGVRGRPARRGAGRARATTSRRTPPARSGSP